MNPGTLNLTIRSGDTFRQTLTITNPSESDPTVPGTAIDLTGCVAEMDIVSTYDIAPVYSLSSTTPTANGGSITLGGAAGTVAISIPPEDTSLLANGAYDFRVKFTDGSIQTFIAGSVFIEEGVTAWTV
jgi:hypothetical protein